MKEPKFTKGPWCVEAVNSEALHDICLGYDVPGAGSPVLLATVYAEDEDDGPLRPGDVSVIEAEANARLMAAAPEMYAELVRLRFSLRAMREAELYGDMPSGAAVGREADRIGDLLVKITG